MEFKPKKNENCELYKGLNVKLYKRCDYCNDRYFDCLGTQYNILMMITFILLLFLPYLKSYPFFFKLSILICIGTCVTLGFLVNSKTDDLYLSKFHLKKKTFEMEKLNRELVGLNESLESRTVELVEANNKLKKLDQMKSDFIATVSHEFRSPLTSIKAFSKILLNSSAEVSPEENVDFLRIIDQETDRLTRLINGILDLSKLESGKMDWNMERVSLKTIITHSVEPIYPLLKNKEIDFETYIQDDLPQVMGDTDQLVQVMTNLLNNAVKFTPKKGAIKITAWLSGEEVQVAVEDTGPGISEGEIHEIFSKFKQGGDSLVNKPKGTGLGLPICKEIIAAHHGKIWVESVVNEGSRFIIALPTICEEQSPLERETLERAAG